MYPQAEQEVKFRAHFSWAALSLVVLACVLRAATKKVVNFLEGKKCTPRQNPGYAYVRVCVMIFTLGA